jgi:hypothetical protein
MINKQKIVLVNFNKNLQIFSTYINNTNIIFLLKIKMRDLKRLLSDSTSAGVY